MSLTYSNIKSHQIPTRGRLLGRNPDRSLKIFLLLRVTSTALRFLFLQIHVTSYSFYSALLYTIKKKGGKPDIKPQPFPMVLEIHTELSRSCPETSKKLYVHEFGFRSESFFSIVSLQVSKREKFKGKAWCFFRMRITNRLGTNRQLSLSAMSSPCFAPPPPPQKRKHKPEPIVMNDYHAKTGNLEGTGQLLTQLDEFKR